MHALQLVLFHQYWHFPNNNSKPVSYTHLPLKPSRIFIFTKTAISLPAAFITLPGKFIDKEKLRDGKYNIAIVFTSSLEGDHFNGAIGRDVYKRQYPLFR